MEHENLKDALRSVGGGGCGQTMRGAEQAQSTSKLYGNPRHLIDALIDYHNRQVNQLHRLQRALPAEMHPEAEQALFELIGVIAHQQIR